ncbi:EcoKI restriction-modification system protein HsdS [Pseudovibrio axinellae]|uniref:EcoKI restriction-modification system protein HsdS n=1 Tax=Pseudovibrio axinellae TaxID=989403 RepID=A0A161V8C6_9HYPH|nr:restriction endonuclease subunit S [Pseudovibrio axinellae]KZL21209.1 EcoKI restriction-modification system protein HsdS [Pseudovibrio axinellae]SEQ92045.1 type I restriction enzyme, S subunit [Pseudovibrio axinellae]
MVKAGYKQTEVGVIPEDWDDKKLSQLCIMKSGESITSKSISETAPYPCYGGNGLRGFTKTFTHDGDYALVGRQGALCGNVEFATGQFFASEHAVVATPMDGTNIKWLSYVLTDMNLNQYSESSAQPGLTVSKILPLKTAAPNDNREQKAIAEALSDVDGLIASLEALIEKKRQIKTGTMQQLLTGKTRLPGFGEGKGFKQTELGEIPEDWDVALIGDYIEFKNGLNKAKKYFGYGTPIINYMDVFGQEGIRKEHVVGCVDVSREEIKNYSAKKGDVFFTRTSETVEEIGLSSVLLDDISSAVFSGFILRGRDKSDSSKIHLNFKKYCFGSEVVRAQIKSSSSYTTRALTNGTLLAKVLFPLPSLENEQIAIASVLTTMEGEIHSLENRLAKTKALKQGMMQELLTGRTRLI